ncbi:MAG: hypothetical protein K6A43_07110 [Treponema sp.]|nr:hypothetical protein [Treponema sp.]
MSETKEFESILNKEEEILVQFAEKQVLLRKAVVEKNWESLLKVMSEINLLSDTFQPLDEKRAELAKNMSKEQLAPYSEQLFKLRRMLVKCKVENQALGEYVKITKNFMDNVFEKAVPSAGTKTYSRNGTIRKPQPQSVIVNQMF